MRFLVLLLLCQTILLVDGRRFWSKAQLRQLSADFTVLWDDIIASISSDETDNTLDFGSTGHMPAAELAYAFTPEYRDSRYKLYQHEMREIIVMPRTPWSAKGNFFSLLTDSERALYTGVNMSDRGLDVIASSSRAPHPLANDFNSTVLSSVRQLVNKTLDFSIVNLPVKNQGAFANSWAFSAVAVMEYLLAIVTNTIQPISTQYFIDCLNKPCTSDSECVGSRCENGYCVDKWWNTVWENTAHTGYAPPFAGYNGAVNGANCYDPLLDNAAPNALQEVIVTGGVMLGRHNREDELIHYIESYGPLIVCIQVDKKVFYYDGGVFSYCIGGLECNHAVVFIGYNNNQFTLKNSWGKDWGENGLFNVKRGCGDDGYSYWASWMHMVNKPVPVIGTEEPTDPPLVPLTIWKKSPVMEKKDYYLTRKLEVDDYLEIKGNARASKVLHVAFITDLYEFPYILVILRSRGYVYQSFKASGIKGPKIYDDLIAPIPDDAEFKITIRIMVDKVITNVNDEESFTGFYHQAPLNQIKYITCESDSAFFESMTQWRMGMDENLLGLLTLTGELDEPIPTCFNCNYEMNCNHWKSLGHCRSDSQFVSYMMEWCAVTCETCPHTMDEIGGSLHYFSNDLCYYMLGSHLPPDPTPFDEDSIDGWCC